MKKSLFGILACMVLTAQATFAALPPFAQSLVELKAILGSEELADQLGMAEAIDEILQIDNGYRIVTRTKQVDVEVVYVPSPDQKIGPLQFDLKFHSPTMIKN